MSSVCGRAGGWVGSGLIYWRIGKRARTPVPAKQKPIRKPSQKKMIIMIMRRRRRRKERERERGLKMEIYVQLVIFYIYLWRRLDFIVGEKQKLLFVFFSCFFFFFTIFFVIFFFVFLVFFQKKNPSRK